MEHSFRKMTAALAAVAWLLGCGGSPQTPHDAGVEPADAGHDAGAICPAGMDADGDGVCDELDKCPGNDDRLDEDGDSVPDGCEVCPGHDDLRDQDSDGVGDACDVCPAGDDAADADGDQMADACDRCPADINDDSDGDGTCDSVDACAGEDDRIDSDQDGFPDACDGCPRTPGSTDSDGDGVCDQTDQCPGNPDGWGTAGQDLDNDFLEDGCDLCAGDNAQGDDDDDGACNVNVAGDNCPGVNDFSAACVDVCPGIDDFSPLCPQLPWRGGIGGTAPNRYACPAGSWSVGVETEDYSTMDSMGAKLICMNASGTQTLVGRYGTGQLKTDSKGKYSLRCDSTHPDGRMVGQIVALHKGTNPQDLWLARPGVVCSSETAALSWHIEPLQPPQPGLVYYDYCSGADEVVTAIEIKTGWWCDGMRVSCTTR